MILMIIPVIMLSRKFSGARDNQFRVRVILWTDGTVYTIFDGNHNVRANRQTKVIELHEGGKFEDKACFNSHIHKNRIEQLGLTR